MLQRQKQTPCSYYSRWTLGATRKLPWTRETTGARSYDQSVEEREAASSLPVLVSACLAGCACGYDGSASRDDAVSRLVEAGRAVLVCPEEDGGLGTPRPPAEIVGGDGRDVLAGRARVVNSYGEDVTDAYLAGARQALDEARRVGATTAILKARSPSCGKAAIYDGSFSRTLRAGDGVTVALLESEGITVLSDEDVRGL